MHRLMLKHAAAKVRRSLAPKPPDPRDLKRLGKAFAARRHEVGLTQEPLVLLTGFKSEYISLLERGGRNPPYTTQLAIARALKTTVARLVPR